MSNNSEVISEIVSAVQDNAGKPKRGETETRGVLIIAVGHGLYGQYAQALALSIRLADKDIPIALVYSKDSIKKIHYKEAFTEFIECPAEYYTDGKRNIWHRPKLYMEALSPYDVTICIDADTIIFPNRKISELFDELKGVDFAPQSFGYVDMADPPHDSQCGLKYDFWAAADDIKRAFDIKEGKMWQLQTSFMYFRKTPKVLSLFEKARDVFETKNNVCKSWNGDIPDEFAFNLATVLTGVEPFAVFEPLLVPINIREAIKFKNNEIMQKWYGLTMAGNWIQAKETNLYNSIIITLRKSGYKYLPLYLNKKGVIATRIKY